MKPEMIAALNKLISRYQTRVDDNRKAHRVEVHIPLTDLDVLLSLARKCMQTIPEDKANE